MNFSEIQLYWGKVKLVGDYVDDVADQRAAARCEDQLGDAVGRRNGRFEIGPAFEAVRGVGVNAVALRHAADGDRVPPRGFDQDVLRFIRDHGVEAAHHAGQTYRLLRVGYDQIIGGELAVNAIQSL